MGLFGWVDGLLQEKDVEDGIVGFERLNDRDRPSQMS